MMEKKFLKNVQKKMINHFFLFTLCVFASEIWTKMDLTNLIVRSYRITVKAMVILTKNSVKDHRKQKVTLILSYYVMRNSLMIFFSLCLLLSCISFLVVFYDSDFLEFIFSISAIIESIIFFSGYALIKNRLNAKL